MLTLKLVCEPISTQQRSDAIIRSKLLQDNLDVVADVHPMYHYE